MESIGTQKSKRTTREQLSYIEFAKKNPNLLASKNDPTSPHRVMDLWSQLADGLNSKNGPVRPTTYVRGKDAVACFESICTADIKGLAKNSGTLTVLTNDKGNILDDLIVSKVSDDLLYVVSNVSRKTSPDEANFPVANEINNQLKTEVTRRRVGIRMTEGPPARASVGIYHKDELVGKITSGCPSPSLGGNVAMEYIRAELKKPASKIELKIRDKHHSADVARMPFTPANYYNKPKASK